MWYHCIHECLKLQFTQDGRKYGEQQMHNEQYLCFCHANRTRGCAANRKGHFVKQQPDCEITGAILYMGCIQERNNQTLSVSLCPNKPTYTYPHRHRVYVVGKPYLSTQHLLQHLYIPVNKVITETVKYESLNYSSGIFLKVILIQKIKWEILMAIKC